MTRFTFYVDTDISEDTDTWAKLLELVRTRLDEIEELMQMSSRLDKRPEPNSVLMPVDDYLRNRIGGWKVREK